MNYSISKDGKTLLYVRQDVKSFTIPDGVTIIGYKAFMGCLNLISVTIPNSVCQLSDYAFADCENLTSIILPNVIELDQVVFLNCTKLESIIMYNVVKIGYNCFYNCKNLNIIEHQLKAEQLKFAFGVVHGYAGNDIKAYDNYLQRNRDYKLKQLENEL